MPYITIACFAHHMWRGDLLVQSVALELLCRCDDISDDGVELKVLKGLLTAVTSSVVHVHGQALLLAVRTCYNIFLMSRLEVNQTTAKASLTQMLNIVFQRMEAGSETVQPSPLAVTDQLGLPPEEQNSVTAFVNNFLHDVRPYCRPGCWHRIAQLFKLLTKSYAALYGGQ